MEVVIWGQSATSKSFQVALYGVLKTMINALGVTSFNVGIQGIQAKKENQPNPWWGENIGQVRARWASVHCKEENDTILCLLVVI